MPLYFDTAPTNESIDLTELKTHLRLGDVTDHDTELAFLISALADKDQLDSPLQFKFKRQLLTATLILTISEFKYYLELPRPPLQSVTSVEYRDENGDWQTIEASNYEVNTNHEPGFIRFDEDYSEPDVYDEEDYPFRVTFVAGYGSAHTSVPKNIKLWAMNVIADYWTVKNGQVMTSFDIVELEASMGRIAAPHLAARRFG